MQFCDWRGCFVVGNEYWSLGDGRAGAVQGDQTNAAGQYFHF